ncbi:CAAD domain-containing protein [Coleofasciculus sp.]|uniref:CAAD domain-containing protein n=1 Tax=Coleofasciculus sp. TaxID=3100458 RepID=UPI0039F98847
MTAKIVTPEQPINATSETFHRQLTSEVLTEEKKQPWVQLISTFIGTVSAYLNNRVTNTEQLLITAALIIAALTILKLGFAVLKAINTIPFLSSLLEIIGIAYVSWFICSYLLSAANRQDLALQVKSFKEQIFGMNP